MAGRIFSLKPIDLCSPTPQLHVEGRFQVPIPDDVQRSFKTGDLVMALARRPFDVQEEKLAEASALEGRVGEVLHVPAADLDVVRKDVSRVVAAFTQLQATPAEDADGRITTFFASFAANLESDTIWREVEAQNALDVQQAAAKGRSTTRLKVSAAMRSGMIEGLRVWAASDRRCSSTVGVVPRSGWDCELVRKPLGVVAFIFEGRPNVLADACGVLRGGNTAILRIGSDAIGTAKVIVQLALRPALEASGLPADAVVLVEAPSHSVATALFTDRRLALAVARGSGRTVETLGQVARQHGIPTSLHGKGGAWAIVAGLHPVSGKSISQCVAASLDRKVCNTLNTIVVLESLASLAIPQILEGLEAAGNRLQTSFVLHTTRRAAPYLPEGLYGKNVSVIRSCGVVSEPQARPLANDEADLGVEHEWEGTPEVSIAVVCSIEEAISLFNQYSPKFVVSMWSEKAEDLKTLLQSADAPFVGDSETRWVDGQKALGLPELGLSNWEHGRLLGRGGILTGDAIATVVTVHREHPK
jgi:glutamate-5-semialdehyde dehydrogenase